MDKFVTRKKRKSSPDAVPDTTETLQDAVDSGDREAVDEDEPTDVKLAMLSSLHPELDQGSLLEFLLAHDGSVKDSLKSLKASKHHHIDSKPPRTRTVGAQTSLRLFTITTSESGQSPPQKKPKILSRKGATLHLYDPEDISQHTPCTIVHNFLPEEEASRLLKELLEESKTFQKITFKLFDNVVSSPHTSGFYVGSDYELSEQKSEYVYNGARIEDVRKLTPWLEKVKPLVQEAVNQEIQERIRTRYGGKKLKYQSPDPWHPNAAFVNCYNGPDENVGWHSDQLTYLGPRAVIGSLSLGVTREFRVRRILPKETDTGKDTEKKKISPFNPNPTGPPSASVNKNPKASPPPADHTSNNSDLEGQIAIHLPHNSLLVMHSEMQEEWKHSIAPVKAIDPHPIAGNRRINITYRDYKDTFHPRRTPRCHCGVPTVLRVVQRKKENWGKYFWMCYAGNVPGKEGCSFFQWAEFDDDGNPKTTTAGDVSRAKIMLMND